MTMHPIIASLQKHRIPAVLIVLEIALACAVLCNAVFIVKNNVSDIHLTNAIDEQGLSIVTWSGSHPSTASADTARNLAALRAIPGVKAVAVTNSMPLDSNGYMDNYGTVPDLRIGDKRHVPAEYYFLGEGADQALGLQLLQGRPFNANDYDDGELGPSQESAGHVVIVTESFARRAWPGQSALGKVLYADKYWYVVVGLVADVLCPDDAARSHGDKGIYFSLFFPLKPNSWMNDYIVRSDPGDRVKVMREAQQRLLALNPDTIAKGKIYTDMRDEYFADAASMVWIMVLVCTVMLAVTAFGIVGLTSFWVQQRRRQIGIRRALGATRRQILGYFRTENFMLTTTGIVLGALLTLAINIYLIRHYEMRLMPWYYPAGSALVLWLLGQIAVLGPASRAAAVPPVVATRSV